MAVSGSGQVLSWGANQHGLLGLGPAAAQNVTSPAPIPHCFGAHVSLATMRLHFNAGVEPTGQMLAALLPVPVFGPTCKATIWTSAGCLGSVQQKLCVARQMCADQAVEMLVCWR